MVDGVKAESDTDSKTSATSVEKSKYQQSMDKVVKSVGLEPRVVLRDISPKRRKQETTEDDDGGNKNNSNKSLRSKTEPDSNTNVYTPSIYTTRTPRGRGRGRGVAIALSPSGSLRTIGQSKGSPHTQRSLLTGKTQIGTTTSSQTDCANTGRGRGRGRGNVFVKKGRPFGTTGTKGATSRGQTHFAKRGHGFGTRGASQSSTGTSSRGNTHLVRRGRGSRGPRGPRRARGSYGGRGRGGQTRFSKPATDSESSAEEQEEDDTIASRDPSPTVEQPSKKRFLDSVSSELSKRLKVKLLEPSVYTAIPVNPVHPLSNAPHPPFPVSMVRTGVGSEEQLQEQLGQPDAEELELVTPKLEIDNAEEDIQYDFPENAGKNDQSESSLLSMEVDHIPDESDNIPGGSFMKTTCTGHVCGGPRCTHKHEVVMGDSDSEGEPAMFFQPLSSSVVTEEADVIVLD